MKNLRCIEKWAARDEVGPYIDLIVIGDKEPIFEMSRWVWRCRNLWTVSPNEGNISVLPGQKKKIHIYLVDEDLDK